MGQLLQILGRGMQIETAELIWNWLGQVNEKITRSNPAQAKLLDKIIEQANEKKTTLLRQHLDEFRRLYPNSHYADLAGGAAALADNRLTDAFDLLKRVYSRCPRNITALYALGHCCERLDRQDDAIAYYQDCLKFKNYLLLPRQRLAAIYFKNGQIQKTIREYQLLAAEYPDDMPTLLTLGYLYIAAGKHKTAADTFSTAILIQPENFSPDTDPIDSLIETGDLYDALAEIDTALADHPDRPDLLLRRASVHAQLGNLDEALSYYNQTLEVAPNFLEANIRLGTHYLGLARHSSAAQQFTRAALLNDRIVDAYLGLATAQKLADNISEALVSLSLAAAIEANSPLLLSEAARLHFHPHSYGQSDADTGSIKSILNAYNRLLHLRPHNPELHHRFGILLMSIGRLHQAIDSFRTAIQLNPTFTSARNKLILGLHETDEKALALENLIPPTCLQPDTLLLHYRLAVLYCDKIKFASSLLDLEQWLHETLTAHDAALNISVVLQNLGLIDPAVAAWDSICLAAQHAADPIT